MNNELAKYIDHTLLKPDATKNEIDILIAEAKKYSFASVCINPHWVTYCAKQLKDTDVKVCTVVGFPLGASTTETKVFETKQAIKSGATEIDLVINIAELKANNLDFVKDEIGHIVKATKEKAITKVIIETALLTDHEKVIACEIAKEAKAHFVKTSTGFADGGATIKDIKLMRKTVGELMGVKASGGIRDKKTAQEMINAGATRIGASAGVSIVNEQ